MNYAEAWLDCRQESAIAPTQEQVVSPARAPASEIFVDGHAPRPRLDPAFGVAHAKQPCGDERYAETTRSSL
jgi:hypothetical protein